MSEKPKSDYKLIGVDYGGGPDRVVIWHRDKDGVFWKQLDDGTLIESFEAKPDISRWIKGVVDRDV